MVALGELAGSVSVSTSVRQPATVLRSANSDVMPDAAGSQTATAL